LVTLFILCVVALGGAVLTYAYDDEASLAERLSAGVCVGMAAFGLIGFLLGLAFGLRPSTIALATLITAAPLAMLRSASVRDAVRRDLALLVAQPEKGRILPAIVHAAALVLLVATLSAVFDRAMIVGPEGIATGVDHNLGDLPFHLAIATSFAWGENIPPEHPELSGTRLTYPFLVDFVAGALIRAGAAPRQAFLFQNLFLVLALVGLLHAWARKLTGDRVACLLVLALVFFNGGLGFLLLFRDVQPREGLFALLGHLPHDYTILPEIATPLGRLRWGNILTTLLLPQRAFLLGLPLFVHVSTLWWKALSEGTSPAAEKRLLLAAGTVTGLLPLCHAHTLVVALATGAGLAVIFRRRSFWIFLATALALGLPQVLWMMHGSSLQTGRFLGWQLGWDRAGQNALTFWLVNAGAFIPLLVLAVLWGGPRRIVPKQLLLFSLPFAAWFVVPNALRLSPWIWDNIKLLVYWHVASTPLVALALARLWRARGGRRLLAVGLFLGLVASGALDVWRVASRSIAHRIFSREAMAFADEVRRVTPPRAVIVSRPGYDSPLFLAGRRTVLGYPGHIWSQGLDAGDREALIKRLYAGETSASSLVARHGVSFIMVSPRERYGGPGDAVFVGGYPIVLDVGEYRLYHVTP
jgi:hypothetical protein